MSQEPSESAIRVYLRARPSGDASPGISLDFEESRANFAFDTPTNETVNNTRTFYTFPFARVFGPSSQQEDVFSVVARPVLEEFLGGKNGCIFAYGQSGSGKTFSLTGGSERYADRGVIPRSLEFLYNSLDKQEYTMTISYLEIYNGVAFDLLSGGSEQNLQFADLARINLQEDEFGNFHMSTSVMAAPNEEEALNLLFLGSIRRSVAETNLNLNSSRSHCVLIAELVRKISDSEQVGRVARSRMYFVDLAGSERVGKTGSEGRVLVESKNINQSLHYLEQVIVALHDKARGVRSHIPYRNSLLTSILKDALGGNSNTVMLATISLDNVHVMESVSTCRFGQRVALIKNVVSVNEELDAGVLIAKLKKEVAMLKEELAVLKAGDDEQADVVTTEEADILKSRINQYVDNEADGLVCGSVAKVRSAFKIFRYLLVEARAQPKQAPPAGPRLPTDTGEIQVQPPLPTRAPRTSQPGAAAESSDTRVIRREESVPSRVEPERQISGLPSTAASTQPAEVYDPSTDPEAISKAVNLPILTILLDRTKAFEAFRAVCPEKAAEISAEDKERLKTLCTDGKALGERANQARSDIARLRQKLESMRLCDAMRSVDGEVDETKQEYMVIKADVNAKTDVYQKSAEELKTIKAEIDRIQFVANQNKHKIQREFEVWYGKVRQRTDIDKATSQTATADNQENSELNEYYKIRDQILNSYLFCVLKIAL